MVLSSSGPPGPKRPKSSSDSPTHPSSAPSHIFSPSPSKPPANWFNLLASPVPSPAPQMPPTAVTAAVPPTASRLDAVAVHSTVQLQSNLVDGHSLVTNISSDNNCLAKPDYVNDPWSRAHTRACAHANDACAACSISIICCSCRALRYTPGPPPPSPTHTPSFGRTNRSRSASPSLFRDLGNPPSPPGFYDGPDYDNDAYTRACAECDTCDNPSCPRGHDEPAIWTITVEAFDESMEEMYDRTFRACGACNRSCKKNFLGYHIKARTFDNSLKMAASNATKALVTPLHASETSAPLVQANLPSIMAPPSRPPTPLEVFSVISYAHRVSCDHTFTVCSTCSLGITCCGCNKLHTAPAQLKLQCSACSHFACATCITPYCCACRKPWFPGDSPTIVLASRFRGGARSTKSSKKGSSSSSQSSGPGSLATAHSERNSPDPFTTIPTVQVTQSSTDEIDAFADKTVKLSSAPASAVEAQAWAAAPSPSSNLPPAPSAPPPVFSCPVRPIISGETEDIPTAVPSRAPSRAASVASISSTGDVGIAELLQLAPFEKPSEPPALSDLIGQIHRRYPLASLKVDDEDSRHFLARDNTRVEDIANETEYLLSSTTTWPSILYFIRDIMKFESIKGRRILTLYHHLPHLDTPLCTLLNAPSSW